MTTATWWPHEVRRCGRQAYVLPVLAALLAYGAVAARAGDGMLLGRALLTCAPPTAAALACAAVVARESMVELHLSLPTAYARTVAHRLAWPAAVTGAAASAVTAVLAATGHRLDLAVTVVELAGLTVLLGGCAVWATVRFGSAAAATGLVVALVLAKLLLIDRVVPEGAAQAVPALLAGGWLTTLALRALQPGGRQGTRLGHDSGPRFGPGEA
ncbi:hypothetical protein AB0D04_25795 [Streptomyces sp. NPDC048483]|uniref:hypothetical protein n=1 Tax=Streptomyces sp. NPDC048483 TaxID=3154927 RepID=UPI0034403AD3